MQSYPTGFMQYFLRVMWFLKVFHVSVDYLLGIEEKSQTLDLSGLTDEDIQVLENTAALLRKKNLEKAHGRSDKQEPQRKYEYD